MYHLGFIEPPEFLRDQQLNQQYRGKRVLVLGADGFIGVHIATAFVDRFKYIQSIVSAAAIVISITLLIGARFMPNATGPIQKKVKKN